MSREVKLALCSAMLVALFGHTIYQCVIGKEEWTFLAALALVAIFGGVFSTIMNQQDKESRS